MAEPNSIASAAPHLLPVEEAKHSSLLKSLHEFEATIIARFLTAKEKLLTTSLLNRKWHRLVSNHYSWSTLPIHRHLIRYSPQQEDLMLVHTKRLPNN